MKQTHDAENIRRLADRIEKCKDVNYEDHKPWTQGPSFSMITIAPPLPSMAPAGDAG